MTSKAKAIEENSILKNAREVYKTRDSDYYLETIRKTADELENELSQPTLDDAIKVVEELAKNNSKTFQKTLRINAYADVLTALKGLKEGKE